MKKKLYKQYLSHLLKDPMAAFEIFHAATKNHPSLPQLEVTKWPKAWTTVFFKDYPRLDKVILTSPQPLPPKTIEDVLMNRHSKRTFSSEALSIEELSTYLYYTAGLRDTTPPYHGSRFYPSPGARYSLETYLISQNTELEKGLYHYNLLTHSLETLFLFDETYNVFDYFVHTLDFMKDASCILINTSIFHRMTMKYGERGYRNILLEGGFLGQNYYLVATAMHLACCSIAGFLDDPLNKLLDIDGVQEAVINTIALGKTPK